MSERARIAFLTACMFVIGLHLRTAGRLIVDGWLGPYHGSEPAEALVRSGDPRGRGTELASGAPLASDGRRSETLDERARRRGAPSRTGPSAP